ncbi:MAG: hypothetical protein D6820_08245, partial [Lentisphaerae bacterium]
MVDNPGHNGGDDSNETKKIIPEIIIPNEHSERGGSAGGNEQQLILSSSVLPERIFIMPVESKPVFPGMVFPLLVKEGYAANLIRHVRHHVPAKIIGFVLTRREEKEQKEDDIEVTRRELFTHGTAARMVDYQEDNEGRIQAVFQAEKRFRILSSLEQAGFLVAHVAYFDDILHSSDEVKALTLAIMNTLRDLTRHNPLFNEEIRMFLSRGDLSNPGKLADFSASMTSASREELQEILACQDVKKRLEKVLFILRKELDLNEL